MASRSFFRVLHADVREISEKIHADLAFEKLAYILRAQVKFVCKYAEAYFFGQMLLQIPCELVYRPLLQRGITVRDAAFKQGYLQIVDAGANSS